VKRDKQFLHFIPWLFRHCEPPGFYPEFDASTVKTALTGAENSTGGWCNAKR
jgi:hypothetical protein